MMKTDFSFVTSPYEMMIYRTQTIAARLHRHRASVKRFPYNPTSWTNEKPASDCTTHRRPAVDAVIIGS
jgi:hypothetical protein